VSLAYKKYLKSGMKIPKIKRILLIIRVPYPKSLIPSADQRGAKILIRKPELKVPSSISAPPHLTTHNQNSKSTKYVIVHQVSDIVFQMVLLTHNASMSGRPGLWPIRSLQWFGLPTFSAA
jgi:hypothetical protein